MKVGSFKTALLLSGFAAAIGFLVLTGAHQRKACPQPSAATVSSLFAPCQAYQLAVDRANADRPTVPPGGPDEFQQAPEDVPVAKSDGLEHATTGRAR
jgi:hypothetical protein